MTAEKNKIAALFKTIGRHGVEALIKKADCISKDGSGCHIWHKNRSKGYGRIYFKGKMYYAHRLIYALKVGRLKQNLMVDHVCRNRSCCNPRHLRQVSPKTNALENSKGVSAVNAAKQFCSNGHPFNKTNTGFAKLQRYCKQCSRERSLRYWRAKKQRALLAETQQ